MRRLALVLLTVVLVWPAAGGRSVAQKKRPKQTLALTLKAVKPTIPAGAEPVLRLTITNVGAGEERILKSRGDLQDTYYTLVVTKDGKPLALARAISDPGPISDKDFRVLKPGKNVAFEFSRYAEAVGSLPPGRYEARIRVWHDPYQSRTSARLSPPAPFTVAK